MKHFRLHIRVLLLLVYVRNSALFARRRSTVDLIKARLVATLTQGLNFDLLFLADLFFFLYFRLGLAHL